MNEIEKRFNLARKELLDLSLKNSLLNYKLRQSSGLELEDVNASDVYDYLVNQQKSISFTINKTSNINRLYSHVSQIELNRKLTKTYRSSKLYLEEKGANILFLALGFLKWKENYSDVFNKAPLILIPVEISLNEVNSTYSISYSGEEIRLNISLIQKLKTEFNIDISYEEDNDSISVNDYFRLVDSKIVSYFEWEVETSKAAFDFFSYAKFLMYKDLDLSIWLNKDNQLDNEVLKKLFITNFDDKLSDNIDIEKDLDPKKICNVVDYDSSQGSVIYDILKGKNIVIQGPPGTGKSQTITNIIASNIANNKSILFVSEKKAALDVVKRRLEKVGLGDLVLELHSEKSNKNDVLKSIEHTLSLGEIKDKEDENLYNKYEEVKGQIDKYRYLLHIKVNNSNLSLVQIFSLALEINQKADDGQFRLVRLDIPNICNYTNEEFSKRLEMLNEFSSLLNNIQKIEKHPLYGILLEKCLPFEQVSIKEKGKDVEEALNSLIDTINQICQIFNAKNTISNIFDSTRLLNSISLLENYRYLASYNLINDDFYNNQKEIISHIKLAISYQKRYKKFNLEYMYPKLDSFLSLADKYFSHSIFSRNKYVQEKEKLLSYFKGPLTNSKLKDNYKFLKDYKALLNYKSKFLSLFNDNFSNLETTDFSKILDDLPKITKFLDEVYTFKVLSQIRMVISCKESIDNLCELKHSYIENKEYFISKLNDFFETCKFDVVKRFSYKTFYLDMSFNELKKTISLLNENIDSISEVVSYNNLSKQFYTLGLDSLYNYYLETNKYDSLPYIFCFEYYDSLINYAYNKYPELALFKKYKLERTIDIFKDLDVKVTIENIKHILQTHYENMPKINSTSKEMTIIRRELQKKRNQMPIRKLLSQTGYTIEKIKPVFMMSPISVANFLPPNELTFDLVVFDEASQVRPVEAFGALLRAKQIVVVGDSKQLPPTNFFDNMVNKYADLSDEDYDVSNMESILSLLLAKNIPQKTLKWHYRSKNQSLISLSNNEFYDHQLKVFPSVYDKDPNQGLVFSYHNETYYDRGNTRTNPLEAKIVVDKVFEHALNNPSLSLGVASFSLSQQEQIYSEFQNRMKNCNNPKIKEFFSMHKDEPFFIKNLESVQGDERDVIFISIGYGYDINHNITMDFGPLNKDGGERRLNVLITRAKVKCVVFSNITSHDINLAKTNSKGVIALKRFLDYAQNRIIYMSKSKSFVDDKLISYLYNKLTDYGYEVDRSIGVDVGIDLSVYDEKLGRYSIGIETDAGSIKNIESTSDRERIRRNVLKNLGWRIYHIYSSEFYLNPKNEFEKLLDFISSTTTEGLEKKLEEIKIERKNNEIEKKDNNIKEYKVYEGIKRRTLVFSDPSSLEELIYKILKVEAPMPISLLKKRLAFITDLNKLSLAYNSSIDKCLIDSERFYIKEGFVYLHEMNTYQIRNRQNADKSLRKVEVIPNEEIQECIKESINNGDGITNIEIIKSCSSYLGINKSDKLEEKVNMEIEELIKENIIRKEDDNYYINL